MADLSIDLDESGCVYFLAAVKFENPQPTTEGAPIGWMPVFRTKEAARAYSGGQGQIGELSLPILSGKQAQ
jgi:hypothetical protein